MIDFVDLKVQIDKMSEDKSLRDRDLAWRIERAVREVEDASKGWEELARKAKGSKTSWLIAQIRQPLSWGHPPPKRLDRLSVVAVDGSQIFPDRHELAVCYLVNIGVVAIHYGTGERPFMKSIPSLFWKDEDLFVRWGGRKVHVDGEVLGMKRAIMEMERLVEQCIRLREEGRERVVGLIDGTLILWRLEGCPQDFKSFILEGFISLLDRMRKERIPLAGYISNPGSTDVVNLLRVKVCPMEYPDCDRCPAGGWEVEEGLPCSAVSGFPDRVLWKRFLSVGESTSIFGSSSKILEEYGDHRVDFFYMRVGEEVARVEVPRWVSEDPELFLLLKSCVWDQVEKGGGYPVVLAEAHEQAVVRGSDRDLFFRMLEGSFVRRGIPAAISAKGLRKRRMAV